MKTCAHWMQTPWYRQAIDGHLTPTESPVKDPKAPVKGSGRPDGLKPDPVSVQVLEAWPFRSSGLLGRTTEPPEPDYGEALV